MSIEKLTKQIINHINYTLQHYPHPEDLEWSTEQIKALLSRIEHLTGAIEKHKKTRPNGFVIIHGRRRYNYRFVTEDFERDEELYRVLEEK